MLGITYKSAWFMCHRIREGMKETAPLGRGGKIVEGYPVIPKTGEMPGVFAFTGLYPAFEKAGYKEVARRSETRAVMRRRLRPSRSVRKG